jgi:putative hemolysin
MKSIKFGGLLLICVMMALILNGCTGLKMENVEVEKQVYNDYKTDIVALFDKKYNQTNSKVEFENVVEDYVRGSIETPTAINLFLAKKVGNKWEISYEGLEDMSCERLKSFSFPEALLKGCNSDSTSATANPASVKCEQDGGVLTMEENANGVDGICNFDDGSFCPEWDYFDEACSKGEIFNDGGLVE